MRHASRGVLPGLLIIALGVLLILNNFDVLNIRDLWRFWPVLVIAFGLGRVVEGPREGRVFGGVLIGVGAVLQLSNLGLLDLNLGMLTRFWPLILIAVGLHLAFRRTRPGNLPAGMLIVALGVGFQLDNLGVFRFDLSQWWPVAIIVIGVSLLVRGLRARSGVG